jgi:predicted nuclease of predicted toxin-antitoxin system
VIRYLLDADLPRSASQALRGRACDAVDVRDIGLGHAPDDVIFRYAVTHHYTLVSADKGFTNLLRFPLGTHAGLIVARFHRHTPAQRKSRMLVRWIAPLDENDVVGNLLIIEPRGVRIRRAKP